MPRLNRLSLLFGAILLVGCRNSRSDLIEAELRTKDRQLRELQGELERTRILNQALEGNIISTQPGTVPTSSTRPPFVRGIEFGSGTGCVDEDRIPGDDVLILVIVPKDEDGHPVKVVGSLAVQTHEITPEGTKIPLYTWDVSPSQLRPLWSQGLFSTGFQVKLAFKQSPRFEKLRVTAQLTLVDGKTLEIDKDVKVHPAANQTLPVLDGPILTKKAASLMAPRPAN